jgi:DNA polymerase I-like protein with 3'-5' exonuclease and polymerase domains/uracil-DNA glycosylase
VELPPIVVSPLHREYAAAEYPEYDEDDICSVVCNSGLVLPENKLGNLWHTPCYWLADTDTDGFTPEEREEAAARRSGWRQADILLVLAKPDARDVAYQVGLHPQSDGGAFMRRELAAAGIDPARVVVTYLHRFSLPLSVKAYGQRHTKCCTPYLLRDIAEIRPKVVIACGAPVVSALLGKGKNLDAVRGGVVQLDLPDGGSTSLIPTVSHLTFMTGYGELSVFQAELARACSIADKGETRKAALPLDYRLYTTVEEVEALHAEIARAAPPFIAFDTETGNDTGRSEFTYDLSVQISWGPYKSAMILFVQEKTEPAYWQVRFTGKPRKKDGTRKAVCREVPERRVSGVPLHTDEYRKQLWDAIYAILSDERWVLGAHHARYDVGRVCANGYPLEHRIGTGYDSMLMHHLLCGDESQGLDHLVRKYCPEFGAFWRELESWLTISGRQSNLRFGYRNIPLDILIPYAQHDAASTWLCIEKLLAELKQQPKLWELYTTLSAPTSEALLDIERQGILVDEDRRMEVREYYVPVYEKLATQLEELTGWKGFNPGSPQQLASLLFHECAYKDAKHYRWQDDTLHRLPEGVTGLGCVPLANTDKYPVAWATIQERGEEEMHSPGTSAKLLEVMAQQHPDKPALRVLRYLSVVGKLLGSYLHPQELNEFGVVSGGKGFHQNIWEDGCVRTRLSQLTETGRYSSSEANLQTKPKKQEAVAYEAVIYAAFGCSVKEYKARCKPEHPQHIPEHQQIAPAKFSSIYVAPAGEVLIEADFQTAELFVWAVLSNDPELLKVVLNGRDMHSEVAITSYHIDGYLQELPKMVAELEAGNRAPYDAAMERFKAAYGAIRTAAKSVNFG